MPTKPQVIVQYYYPGASPSAPSYTVPSGLVQSVSYSSGRQNITDQWQGGSATIYGRSPSSLAQTPTIGQHIRLQVYNEYAIATYSGFISDYRVIYGKTTAYDTFEIAIESPFNLAGRATATVTAVAGQSTFTLAQNAGSAITGTITYIAPVDGFTTTTSAQTYTEQVTSPLTDALNTDGGMMRERTYDSPPEFAPQTLIQGHNSVNYGVASTTFTDVAADPSSYVRYEEVQFYSAAYNYGTKVVVQAAGFADQVSGSGSYSQTISTVNETASQAANLAGYLKEKFNYAATVPYAITYSGAANTQEAIGWASPEYVGYALVVKFRGNTYNCIIEGMSFTANATDYRATLYLSASLQNAFLRLDNSVYGKLDNNKLGF